MAASMISEIGSEFGPCSSDCPHPSCTSLRNLIAETCHWCDEQIGYGVRFYQVENGYVHALCEEMAIEEGRS